MKKIVVLVVIMLIGMNATEMFSQNKYAKSSRETKETIKMIRAQIDGYQKNIRALEYVTYEGRPVDTAQIRKYRTMISALENKANDLIVADVDNKSRESLKLKGGRHNPQQLADAYLTVKYADNLDGNRGNDQAVTASGLKAVVINNYYAEVSVTVSGPGGFFTNFNLKSKGKLELDLPMIGQYTTTFVHHDEQWAVTKKVGPRFKYFSVDGTPYDYMATLQSTY